MMGKNKPVKKETIKKKKILIVDDEVDLVEMVKLRLENKGYEVTCAYNGMEGLERLEDAAPDLIILDMKMPKVGGLEFYNKISTSYGRSKYPVLVMTGKTEFETLFKDIKADGFIGKPFDFEVLIKEIERIISGKVNPTVFLIDLQKNPHVKKIAEVFQSERYEVINLEKLAALQTTARSKKPDFIIMEYIQEEMAGEAFIRKIKEDPIINDVPIVVYSYFGFEGHKEKCLGAGAETYLGKPKDYKDFIAVVREIELKKTTSQEVI
jgi:CheY-like chemotaxis protein